MDKPEFDTEFCNVRYIEEDRLVLLTWKKFCFFDNYREPVFYALSLLRYFSKSTLAVDVRNGFAVVREDVEWNFFFLLPSLLNTSCKQVIMIRDNSDGNNDMRNPWTEEFLKHFTVKKVGSYQEAVRANRYRLKQIMNKLTGGLLIYELFMLMTAIIYMIGLTVFTILTTPDAGDMDALLNNLMDQFISSGIYYIIAIIPGILFLYWFYRKLHRKHILFQSKRKMSVRSFLMILCVFMSAQSIFNLIGYGAEAVLNQFGLSIMSSIEAASGTSTTISMFLYASLLAPVTEEIIFRGFLLKSLEKYGRVFAIVISAILFGAFHGNLIQGIFAITTGLVFGYVAIEYSIKWSILLHIVNNFVFGDLLSRLISNFNDTVQSIIWNSIEGVFFVGAVIVLIYKRKDIGSYLKREKSAKGLYRAAFSSAWVIVFLILQLLLSLSGIERI